ASADTALAAARKQLDQITMKAKEPAATRPSEPAVVLDDDFGSARPEVWKTGAGQWEYKDKHLVQSESGEAERGIVSVAEHPQDFTARFRFRITGGRTWQSVGLSFDAADAGAAAESVYLSAHGGGAVAVFRKPNGTPIDPP